MEAEAFVHVPCVICGEQDFKIICSTKEIESHLKYLQQFHRRRLRPGPDGHLPQGSLADRADFTQDDPTKVVACLCCNFIFRTPRPSKADIAKAYQGDQYGDERLASLFAAQVEQYHAKLPTLRRWLPKKQASTVVEVGSFVGAFLVNGQQQGWQMIGVDPGEEVGAFCRTKGLRVFPGPLSELPLSPGSVDGVVIWNTFDQLPDPRETLAAACRLLSPNGILTVRVPNGECFRIGMQWMQRMPPPWNGWLRALFAWNNLLAFPYLHGYSVSTLDRLMSEYGFIRIAAYADTLVPLSDARTKTRAAQEEKILKWTWGTLARLESWWPASTMRFAPWLDVYYRFIAVCDPLPRVLPASASVPYLSATA